MIFDLPLNRAAALGLALTLLATTALSQTASDVTPDSFQPQLQALDGAVQFTGQAGTEAPAGADQIGITLSDVSVNGGFDELAAANEAFRTRLTRGQISVAELFTATADLERQYAQAGFILARVVLEQQELRDGGVLRVSVIEGFVEDIETENLPEQVRDRVKLLTDPLVDQKRLASGELERRLLLAGDIPGLALESALAPGKKEGGTVIAFNPMFQPVTGFVGLDTTVPDDLGGYALNAGVEFNSPFKMGEVIYLRFAGTHEDITSDEARFRTLAGGAVVPVGDQGLSFNLEHVSSVTTPDDAAARTSSNFNRTSLRVFYPFIRSRQANLSGTFSIDRQSETQDDLAVDAQVFEDRMGVLRLGVSGSWQNDRGSAVFGGLTLSRGQDWFGAISQADAAASGDNLSRIGADVDFSKLAGSVGYRTPLGNNFGLSLAGRFQSSFGDPLLASERFTIVGTDGISAYESGVLQGDNGWVVRAEVSYGYETQLGEMPVMLSPYAFAARGEVTNENPTAVEVRTEDASAFGIGVDVFGRGSNVFQATTGKIEYAVGDRSNGSDNSMFSFTVSRRF